MAPGGALTLHIGSPFFHPERVRSTLASLRQVFPVVVPYFAWIPVYGSMWGFASASDSLDPSKLEPAAAEQVISARCLTDLQYYNGDTHRAVFALPNYVKDLVR